MSSIDFNSRSGIEDTLWMVGSDFHNLSRNQRWQVLTSISSNLNRLSDKDILDFVNYVMHSYFILMDDDEKKALIHLVLNRFGQEGYELDEGLELIALLIKGCPSDCRSKLVEIIINQTIRDDTNPCRIISYANAIRYVFDEIGVEEQRRLYASLQSIYQCTKYGFLKPTVLYSINNVKALLKT